jgi:hypothetical protein
MSGSEPGRDHSLEMQLSLLRERVSNLDRMIQRLMIECEASSGANEPVLVSGLSDRVGPQLSFARPRCESSRRTR